MTVLNSTAARANFYGLIAQVNESHEPITIKGKKGNAVLISEEDWRAAKESLYLVGIPNMRDSIVEGLNASVDECYAELDW